VKGSREYQTTGDGNSKKQICFKFQKSGTCKFGAKCRYLHKSAPVGYGGSASERDGKKPCFTGKNLWKWKLDYDCRLLQE